VRYHRTHGAPAPARGSSEPWGDFGPGRFDGAMSVWPETSRFVQKAKRDWSHESTASAIDRLRRDHPSGCERRRFGDASARARSEWCVGATSPSGGTKRRRRASVRTVLDPRSLRAAAEWRFGRRSSILGVDPSGRMPGPQPPLRRELRRVRNRAPSGEHGPVAAGGNLRDPFRRCHGGLLRECFLARAQKSFGTDGANATDLERPNQESVRAARQRSNLRVASGSELAGAGLRVGCSIGGGARQSRDLAFLVALGR
jgi:hypothetical protein